MKQLLILLSIMILSSCSGWTYNGIKYEDLKHPTPQMAIGFVTSFATHTAGHFLAAKLTGNDIRLEGFSELVDYRASDNDAKLIAASGFGLQILTGYALKLSGFDNDFTKGYHTGTMVEVVSYPLFDLGREKSDLRYFKDHGGNDVLLYGVSSAASIALTMDWDLRGWR